MTETVIYPIENGKIAEKWSDKDTLGSSSSSAYCPGPIRQGCMTAQPASLSVVSPAPGSRGPAIGAGQPARRRGEAGWVHDVCPSQTD